MSKKALRRELLAQRRALNLVSWQAASVAAQLRLVSLEVFRQASTVALYSPILQEIDTALLFSEARSCGKRVLYPTICGADLHFSEVSETGQRRVGAFGILEPLLQRDAQSCAVADLIVVPGVVFDLIGHRIGFGKGYYDRYLNSLANVPVLVGLCHDFQLLDHAPCEGHDVRMHYVITDKRQITLTEAERRNRQTPD